VADDLCIIRSMVTDAINHDPAHTLMNTATIWAGLRWVRGSYGLGSESEDFPGFVVTSRKVAARSPSPRACGTTGFARQFLACPPLQGRSVLYLNARPA
jgi:hypothetical protein